MEKHQAFLANVLYAQLFRNLWLICFEKFNNKCLVKQKIWFFLSQKLLICLLETVPDSEAATWFHPHTCD